MLLSLTGEKRQLDDGRVKPAKTADERKEKRKKRRKTGFDEERSELVECNIMHPAPTRCPSVYIIGLQLPRLTLVLKELDNERWLAWMLTGLDQVRHRGNPSSPMGNAFQFLLNGREIGSV